jgi:hypothetical protein
MQVEALLETSSVQQSSRRVSFHNLCKALKLRFQNELPDFLALPHGDISSFTKI